MDKNKLFKIVLFIWSHTWMQFICWFLALYFISLFVVVNPIISLGYNVNYFTFPIYYPNLILKGHIISILIVVVTLILAVKFYGNDNIKEIVVRKDIPTDEIVNKILPDDDSDSITVTGNGDSYLKPNAIPVPITDIINKKTGKNPVLYDRDDLLFNFHLNPHVALIGASGAGKSIAAKNLIGIFNKQYHYPATIILDAGGADFKDALARKNCDIHQAIEFIYWIVEGRAHDPEGTVFFPILVILEEAEAFWGELSLLKKTEQSEFNTKFASLILKARKFNVNFLIIAQTAAAGDSIPTKITNNIANRFYMRLEKNASIYIHKLPFDLGNLDSGVAYYNKIDDFVRFEHLHEEPRMNVVTWDTLEKMAKEARRKHELSGVWGE